MPNDDAAPGADTKLTYEIAQSSHDPNRPWQIIGTDAVGNEYCRVGFRTYGEAWLAAQRRAASTDASQADLLSWIARRQEHRPSDYRADMLAWSDRQAALLQRLAAGETVSDQIDWENVIEEVQSAGRRQLAALKSLLVQALTSLLKARAWPGSPEVPCWRREAFGFQRDAAAILDPKMRQKIDINEFYFKAIRSLPKTVNGDEPLLFPTECPVTLDELLEDR